MILLFWLFLKKFLTEIRVFTKKSAVLVLGFLVFRLSNHLLPKTKNELTKICNEPGKNSEQKEVFENYPPLQTGQIIGYQIQKVWENLEI